jgi:hypothetical protein
MGAAKIKAQRREELRQGKIDFDRTIETIRALMKISDWRFRLKFAWQCFFKTL